jgi:hypothetical protein
MNTARLVSTGKSYARGIALAAFLASGCLTHAAVLSQYTFATGTTATTTGAGIQTNTVGGGGFVAGSAGGSNSMIGYSGSQQNIFISAGAQFATSESSAFGAKNSYFNLTLAPTSGNAISISTVEFSFGAFTSVGDVASILTPSTVTFGVRISTDGGATFSSTLPVATRAIVSTSAASYQLYDANPADGNGNGTSTGPTAAYSAAADRFSFDLSSVSLSSVTGTVIIQIAGWWADYAGSANVSAVDALRLDNLTVTGSVSAIPEPSTYAALAGFGMLGFAAFRRGSRRR